MEKIKIYTVKQDGGGAKLYSTSLEDLLETLKFELENLEDNDEWTFSFGTTYLTQEEIDSAGEFDGF